MLFKKRVSTVMVQKHVVFPIIIAALVSGCKPSQQLSGETSSLPSLNDDVHAVILHLSADEDESKKVIEYWNKVRDDDYVKRAQVVSTERIPSAASLYICGSWYRVVVIEKSMKEALGTLRAAREIVSHSERNILEKIKGNTWDKIFGGGRVTLKNPYLVNWRNWCPDKKHLAGPE